MVRRAAVLKQQPFKREFEDPIFCIFPKIYLSASCADEFLTKVVSPAMVDAEENGVEYFFFLRYRDKEGFHIRLRLFGEKSLVLGPTRKEFLTRLRQEGAHFSDSNKIIMGQYRPEWNRYGGRIGVRFAERLFDASSRAILDFLKLRRKNKDLSKVEFAVTSSTLMLNVLGLNKTQRNQFFVDFAPDNLSDEKNKTEAFYEVTRTITDMLQECHLQSLDYWLTRDKQVHNIMLNFNKKLQILRKHWELREAEIGKPLPLLCSSYYHMHLNRLALQPAEELILRYANRLFAKKIK